jgi:hypothetical protein
MHFSASHWDPMPFRHLALPVWPTIPAPGSNDGNDLPEEASILNKGVK